MNPPKTELQQVRVAATPITQLIQQLKLPSNFNPNTQREPPDSTSGFAGRKAAGQNTSQVAAHDAASASGYSAPVMPTESVDMFSGLDLPGFALNTVQPEAAQPAPEPLADRHAR